MSLPDVAGLVLAGGRSTRLGEDKAALTVDGMPQVQQLAGILRPLVDAVVVSVARGGGTRDSLCNLEIIEDAICDQGPLAGITSMHRVYPQAAVLVTAVDLFGLTSELVRALLELRRSRAEVILRDGNHVTALSWSDAKRPEPPCSIWEPELLEAATLAFDRGGRSPLDILNRAHCSLLTRSGWHIRDVNTRRQLAAFHGAKETR